MTEYAQIDWGNLPADAIIEILPGNPNTTAHKAAIQDHAAQSVLNCTNRRGVFELSDRCRQFAPSPIEQTSVDCSDSSPTNVLLRVHTGGNDVTGGWLGGGGTLTGCASGWGVWNGTSVVCSFTGSGGFGDQTPGGDGGTIPATPAAN